MPKQYSYDLQGLKTVQSNLTKALATIEGKTKAGLLEAGFLILNRALPLTPVDTGNLRGSAGVDSEDTPNGAAVSVFYGAHYSTHVHERLELTHRPPTQAKFLETAVKESIADIVSIVAARAKV